LVGGGEKGSWGGGPHCVKSIKKWLPQRGLGDWVGEKGWWGGVVLVKCGPGKEKTSQERKRGEGYWGYQ